MNITISFDSHNAVELEIARALGAALAGQPAVTVGYQTTQEEMDKLVAEFNAPTTVFPAASVLATAGAPAPVTPTDLPIPGPSSFEGDESSTETEDAGVPTNAEVDNWGVQYNPAIHSSNHKIYTDGKDKGRFHRRKNVPAEQYDAAYADRRNGSVAAGPTPPIPGPGTASAPVFAGTGQSPGYIPPAGQPGTHVPAGPAGAPAPPAPPAAGGAMDFNGFVQYVTALMNRKPNPFPAPELNAIIQAAGYQMLPHLAQPALTNPNLIPGIVLQIQLRDAALFPQVG